MNNLTKFSPCRKYRYTLWRKINNFFAKGYVVFICLNPSTADETKNDPTIRRCINYALSWGYSELCVLNLFAYRETNPLKMMKAKDPIGPDNDKFIIEITKNADKNIAAWGANGSFLNRSDKVKKMIPNLECLKITKNGFPAHPLYLPGNLKPIPFKEKL